MFVGRNGERSGVQCGTQKCERFIRHPNGATKQVAVCVSLGLSRKVGAENTHLRITGICGLDELSKGVTGNRQENQGLSSGTVRHEGTNKHERLKRNNQ